MTVKVKFVFIIRTTTFRCQILLDLANRGKTPFLSILHIDLRT